jgi:hypothetical protein
MNIRPRPGNLCDVAIQSISQLRPVSQGLFLAVGMLVPAPDIARLG